MARCGVLCSTDAFVFPEKTTLPRFGLKATQAASTLAWLIFPLTLGLAITRQSLWIDEGFTVWFASASSLHSFFETLIGSRGAPGDPQFIFYLLHTWAWIKIFGSSELSLRAANIPFAVLFVYTMSWASNRLFWNRNLWALFCLSPFFWFYLNEARPYLALLTFATVATVAVLAYLIDPERYGKTAPWFCLVALFLAWGTHILAAFLFATLLIFVVTMIASDARLRSDLFRDWWRPAIWCSPAFLSLAAFYVWVSSNGVSKTDGKPGIYNLAFALYEFAGFAGLGPPRNDIRQSRHLSVFLPYWPWLLLGAMALAAVILMVLRAGPSKICRKLVLSAVAGLAIAMGISAWQDFQVLGRHLAVFLPVLLIPVMLPPKHFSPAPRYSRKLTAAAIALGAVWAISDLRLVFMTKYQKDSYREACSLALSLARNDGARILWVADPIAARYYGLTVTPPPAGSPQTERYRGADWPELGSAIDGCSWTLDQARAYLRDANSPVILVLSKPENSDPNSAWRSLIDSSEFTPLAKFNAFTVFEWRPSRASI